MATKTGGNHGLKESIMLMEMLKLSKCSINQKLRQKQEQKLKVIHGNMIKMLLKQVKVLILPRIPIKVI